MLRVSQKGMFVLAEGSWCGCLDRVMGRENRTFLGIRPVGGPNLAVGWNSLGELRQDPNPPSGPAQCYISYD